MGEDEKKKKKMEKAEEATNKTFTLIHYTRAKRVKRRGRGRSKAGLASV